MSRRGKVWLAVGVLAVGAVCFYVGGRIGFNEGYVYGQADAEIGMELHGWQEGMAEGLRIGLMRCEGGGAVGDP